MNISQLMLIWQWLLIAMMLHMKVSLTSISNKLKKNVSTVKIYDYINDRGEHAEFKSIPAPKTEFKSILETFIDGLAQEQDVTRRFYNLSEIAQKDKDYATISFLNWFLDEQVEEESTFETHIDYLNRIGDDCNTLYLYEKELAARSFDEE